MRKLINFLMRLGVVEGPTFRLRVEDGVGVFLEPNPRPNRVNPQAVQIVEACEKLNSNRRASGRWTAKPLHMPW